MFPRSFLVLQHLHERHHSIWHAALQSIFTDRGLLAGLAIRCNLAVMTVLTLKHWCVYHQLPCHMPPPVRQPL